MLEKAKKETEFFIPTDEVAKRSYQFLSAIEPDKPIGTELVATIGDVHGDVYTMLQQLVQNGIIKVVQNTENPEEYKIVKGDYKDNFKRVIFLGDYVDRGPSSIEVMKNVARLNKLFNPSTTSDRPTEGSEGRDDFMKFLCGNHDALLHMYTIDQNPYKNSKQQAKEISDIINAMNQSNDYKDIVVPFYQAISVAHEENLSGNKKVYFTHAYCTKQMKEAIVIYDGWYELNNGEINILDKGNVNLIDKLTRTEIIDILWTREFNEDGTHKQKNTISFTSENQHERRVHEIFVHGHDPLDYECLLLESSKYAEILFNSPDDSFLEMKCSFQLQTEKIKEQLEWYGGATIDYKNSVGYRCNNFDDSASSCMIIDQDGNFCIKGSSLIEDQQENLIHKKFEDQQFSLEGYSNCMFNPKHDLLDKQITNKAKQEQTPIEQPLEYLPNILQTQNAQLQLEELYSVCTTKPMLYYIMQNCDIQTSANIKNPEVISDNYGNCCLYFNGNIYKYKIHLEQPCNTIEDAIKDIQEQSTPQFILTHEDVERGINSTCIYQPIKGKYHKTELIMLTQDKEKELSDFINKTYNIRCDKNTRYDLIPIKYNNTPYYNILFENNGQSYILSVNDNMKFNTSNAELYYDQPTLQQTQTQEPIYNEYQNQYYLYDMYQEPVLTSSSMNSVSRISNSAKDSTKPYKAQTTKQKDIKAHEK